MKNHTPPLRGELENVGTCEECWRTFSSHSVAACTQTRVCATRNSDHTRPALFAVHNRCQCTRARPTASIFTFVLSVPPPPSQDAKNHIFENKSRKRKPYFLSLFKVLYFNAQLRQQKASNVNELILDVVMMTEMWMYRKGDEAYIAELTPVDYSFPSFLRVGSRCGRIQLYCLRGEKFAFWLVIT